MDSGPGLPQFKISALPLPEGVTMIPGASESCKDWWGS